MYNLDGLDDIMNVLKKIYKEIKKHKKIVLGDLFISLEILENVQLFLIPFSILILLSKSRCFWYTLQVFFFFKIIPPSQNTSNISSSII